MYEQQGMTLTELMVVIVIIAIIATIAVPSFIEQIKRMEANHIQTKVTSMLKLAKVESLIRRQNLAFCLADASNVCHKNAQDRLILFTDSDDNHRYEPAADALLQQTSLDLRYGEVYLRAGGRHYVKFYGDSGKPRGHMGHVKYCPKDNDTGRMYLVSFNMSGGITIKPKRNHDTECP